MTSSECVGIYAAAWNERDATKRAAQLEAAWAVDGVYCDPTAHVVGRDALAEHIGNVHASLGGFAIGPTSAYDQHHEFARWTWRMTKESGEPLVDGVSVARLGDHGQIVLLIGFFEPIGRR